ncbi:MAG: chemotaxis protein CheD [Rhodospirillaceae bacterium]
MPRHSPAPSPLQPITRTLMPGDLYCDRTPQCLGTVLGSCVSVCLWDQQLRFGGMNHYLLPNRPSNGDVSPKFGDIAVPQLIEAMIELGSKLRNLQAKLFGGAYVLHAGDPAFAVGRRNIEVAVTELRRRRIPIVASRLSGTQGLVIRQCTGCGDVWVRPTGSKRAPHPAVDIQDLCCAPDDVATAMVIRSADGLPVAISARSQTGTAGRCHICSSSPIGWRRA